tara:strand:- start:5474 stop:6208 length:735 start_codon:yes stop_codon:yes gene_type:complete
VLLSLAAGMLSKPKKIDPNEVYKKMSSPHNQTMLQRSQDMIDPDSDLMRDSYNRMLEQGQDSLYTQNRVNRMNMAASGMGGQSGIMNAQSQANLGQMQGNLQNAYRDMLSSNLGASNQILGQVTQNDMTARDAMTSAYGQNITNRNNWSASMAGNVMKAAAPLDGAITSGVMGMFSDKTMKKNIKKIGTAKTKNGKKVNLYRFQFKGTKKYQTGVMAQEIKKSHPEAVSTGSNGKLKVNYKALF